MTIWPYVCLAVLGLVAAGAQAAPLALCPENPRYFLFRGRPTVLLTSGEHYGAVLNPDFAYAPYLDELKRCGFNLTRLFTGSYVEPDGAFGIARNTLAPAPGRFLCPWARSSEPGYAGGGSRFDLKRRDAAYFRRLRGFCVEAGRRGIVVEVVLFCPYYGDEQWRLSPFHERNNVNGIGQMDRESALTLRDPGLVAIQDEMTRWVVGALRDLDNVYYEICNEPYFGGVTLEWQRHIAGVIRDAERTGGPPHLIAQNIANGSAPVADPDPRVSVFNFHYASPPDAVAVNHHLCRPTAFDETGFRGTADAPYRSEAWSFLLAGGAVYSMLDYSFTVGNERGTFVLPEKQPGGGGAPLRRQLAVLKRLMGRLDLRRARPEPQAVVGASADGTRCRVLGDPGRAYLLYMEGPGHPDIRMVLPKGAFDVRWIDTMTGDVLATYSVTSSGGEPVDLRAPDDRAEVAAWIAARKHVGAPREAVPRP